MTVAGFSARFVSELRDDAGTERRHAQKRQRSAAAKEALAAAIEGGRIPGDLIEPLALACGISPEETGAPVVPSPAAERVLVDDRSGESRGEDLLFVRYRGDPSSVRRAVTAVGQSGAVFTGAPDLASSSVFIDPAGRHPGGHGGPGARRPRRVPGHSSSSRCAPPPPPLASREADIGGRACAGTEIRA